MVYSIGFVMGSLQHVCYAAYRDKDPTRISGPYVSGGPCWAPPGSDAAGSLTCYPWLPQTEPSSLEVRKIKTHIEIRGKLQTCCFGS